MCGLAGWIQAAGCAPAEAEGRGADLARTIARRGPDGRGVLFRAGNRIGLVHARLAIIDVSEKSDQPLVDAGSGAAIVYNGELYNYRALRAELRAQGVVFQTGGDTEVILKGYLARGADFFSRMRGMYAFVIHDPRSNELVALRDPLGIKPLYVRHARDGLLFGSSPRGLAKIGGGESERDPAAAVSLALLGCVLDPFSVHRDVRMLPPGLLHRWRLTPDRVVETRTPVEPARAWSEPPPRGAEALEAALSESVDAHFESDVPVAVFQSAGLDSRVITALAARAGHRPHLLTLSFEEFRGTPLDEAPDAAAFARRLDLPHSAVHLDFKGFQDLREAFLNDMESPTIDGINTYLVAKLCREVGMKVALSGLGGDELFAGYGSFRNLPAGYRIGRIVGAPAIRPVTETVARWAARDPNRPPKVAHLAAHLSDMRALYLLQRSVYLPQDAALALDPDVLAAGLPRFMSAYGDLTAGSLDPAPRTVRRFERDVYMRNMLLKDADWGGMAHGVEIRTPFVDVELMRTLCDAEGDCAYRKSDLRRLLARLAGAPERARRKVGFSVPYQLWFAGGAAAGETAPAHGIRRWCREVIEASFPGWGARAA
jgi:asparagine synthase (glutamine-hydrolysing)